MQNDKADSDSEDDDPRSNLGFTKELIDEIRSTKANNPGMFVSAWQEDDQGIREADSENIIDKFLKEAEDGNVEALKDMLSKNPELLKATDEDGYTALHRAAYSNQLDALSFLLEAGADPEARTKHGWTALHSAANWANYEIIGRLISHGVDANARSEGSVTPLHLAINGQYANARSEGSVTPLHLAISGQCEDGEHVFQSVRYLLQAPGIDAAVKSGAGDTPLDLARRTSAAIYTLITDHLNR
ncbi:ankyrin repeat protein [Oesophagostomum dentatum]|uniref:Ankyrin repeat protein n=1 Tax=Oesophagostomum dentatum TaxID=61180 RepID=A0A0B1TGE5_OESDE|nr:ankyrin repeat protein [Oesophagostomum dentatum]